MALILALDDDKYFRLFAAASLGSRGHMVLDARRCSEADEAIARGGIDLVLVDGLLPDGDGVAWIERLRKSGSQVPVLYVSSFSKDDRRLQGLGVSGIVRKPIGPEVLAAKVENALRPVVPEAELTETATEQLAVLRAAYEQELPGLLAGVREAIRQLRANPTSAPLRGVARRRAHQVAGAAGSFGFGEVGDVCAELEQSILERDWRRLDATLPALGPLPALRAVG